MSASRLTSVVKATPPIAAAVSSTPSVLRSGGLTFSDDGSGYVYADNGDVWYQTDSNVFVNNNTGETICGGLSCFA